MSVTDELRGWFARELASWHLARERFDELTAIADRIDERHERALRESYDCAAFSHHHAPTVEDVLREFAEKITDSQIPNVHPTYEEAIAEYAAKLRLAEEEDDDDH